MIIMETSEDYVLTVSDLCMSVSNQTVLDKISFRIKKGTTLAIVGPNGAGKTMLFRALLKLVPYRGKIEWSKGVKIGYVPQILSVRDIPISVREFLSIKKDSSKNSEIESSLSSVGLDHGMVLSKSLGALSGGELRRVLIAWGIIDKPNVLLFDEPTSGVDLGGEEAIYRMLKKLTTENGITLLLISHDLHIVREYSDHVLALNKCLTFFGESKEVMDPNIQKIIYGEPVCREFGDFVA